MDLYVGTSGYKYPKWKGKFYPAKMPGEKMLPFYATHFRSVEINNTFYGLPATSVAEAWADDVPMEFRFSLKAPQKVTHFQRLKDAGESVSAFLDFAAVFKGRLGLLLFQLPPNMKKDAARLKHFLAGLSVGSRAAFEFRHASWFDDEVFGLLRDHKAALCVAEEDDDLQVPFVATADWGYLRLRRLDYTAASLKKWREAFVFFKHEDEAKGPAFAKQFLELAK